MTGLALTGHCVRIVAVKTMSIGVTRDKCALLLGMEDTVESDGEEQME